MSNIHDDDDDDDRLIDRCGFVRRQFEIFKHEYRELAADRRDRLAGLFGCDAVLRENGSIAARRIERIRRWFNDDRRKRNVDDKEDEEISELCKNIDQLSTKFEPFFAQIKSDKMEFSQQTAPLLPFDVDDLSLLIGPIDDDLTSIDTIKDYIAVTETIDGDTLNRLIHDVDRILIQFTRYIHNRRHMCDEFVYI